MCQVGLSDLEGPCSGGERAIGRLGIYDLLCLELGSDKRSQATPIFAKSFALRGALMLRGGRIQGPENFRQKPWNGLRSASKVKRQGRGGSRG